MTLEFGRWKVGNTPVAVIRVEVNIRPETLAEAVLVLMVDGDVPAGDVTSTDVEEFLRDTAESRACNAIDFLGDLVPEEAGDSARTAAHNRAREMFPRAFTKREGGHDG